MLGHREQLTKTLLDEVDVLAVVADARGHDEALLGGNVVHDELLEHAGIEVVDVAMQTEAGHAQGLVAVGSSKQGLLSISEGVVFGQVLVQVVGSGVLVAGNVCSEHGSGLKRDVDHHLEHIGRVVLDAVAAEVGALLVVVHLHAATGHLDHAVVDGFVGVLDRLQIGVFQGEKRTGSFVRLVTGADVDQEAY